MSVVLGVLGAAAISYAQAPPDFLKAREARDAALRAGNEQEWGRYVTDDFMFVTPAGAVQTKAERMAVVKGNKIAVPPRSDFKVRVYGDALIETFVSDGANGPIRQTAIWVKENGTWKLASVNQTLIGKK
jgi:hypothetical protein